MKKLTHKLALFIANNNPSTFFFIIFGILILSIISYDFLEEANNKKLLSKNFKKTLAIYDDYNNSVKGKPFSNFYFYLKNTKIKFEEDGIYDFLELGDTVLIKYSIEDPNVAEVIDFCYMKKHKGKDYCDN